MADPTLVLLHYSPWSERAHWAFLHHGIAFKRVDHLPVLGELKLRRLVGRRDGKPATVPVLRDGHTVITDSWDIARWADRHGEASPLIPDARAAEVRHLHDVADEAMRSGRALVVTGILGSVAALDESMPPGVPGWVRAMSRPINRLGTKWFANKYGVRLGDMAPYEAGLRVGLDALRAALKQSSPYLLGEFSYADIAMATLLQGVRPVADAYIPLGPGTRAAWTQERLAAEYHDLIGWRDSLYQRHRPAR